MPECTPECWLRSNPRAVWSLLSLPAVVLLAGLGAIVVGLWRGSPWPWLAIAGGVSLVATLVMTSLWRWHRLPRLAYADGQLLVYLQGTQPEQVPIEQVEVFFRGQSDAQLPGRLSPDLKTNTVVVRLAEADASWHAREVRSWLGQWSDGYIIIRGTWTEPITVDLMRALNRRLVEVHRARQPCGHDCSQEGCGT